MAFSYSFKCLPLLLAVASLITIALADQALINSICSHARTQALCQQVFKNSLSADRAGLGKISVDVALGKVKNTLDLVKKLEEKATDPRTKNQYETCVEEYSDALDDLNESKTAFAEHDFDTANIKASGADTGVDTCADEAKSAPPQLKAATQENEDYIDIVLAVANI